MTLHNYWWLLIWAFLFGGISFAFIPKQEEYVLSRRVVRWDWLSAAALAVPYVIWAGWRTNTYGDTGVYRNTFLSMPTGLGGLWSYVSTRRTGYGFVFFEYLFKTLISRSDIAFFTVLAAVQMLLLVSVFRKYSRNYWLSLFFFVASTDYLSWMHNGIRQFLAVTIIFDVYCGLFCNLDPHISYYFSAVHFYYKWTGFEHADQHVYSRADRCHILYGQSQ